MVILQFNHSWSAFMLFAIGMLLTFSLGLTLWASGNSRIPVELKNSLGPDQLEVIREDLAFRKHLGQLMIVSLCGVLTVWMAN
jgi:hypothetical protein